MINGEMNDVANHAMEQRSKDAALKTEINDATRQVDEDVRTYKVDAEAELAKLDPTAEINKAMGELKSIEAQGASAEEAAQRTEQLVHRRLVTRASLMTRGGWADGSLQV